MFSSPIAIISTGTAENESFRVVSRDFYHVRAAAAEDVAIIIADDRDRVITIRMNILHHGITKNILSVSFDDDHVVSSEADDVVDVVVRDVYAVVVFRPLEPDPYQWSLVADALLF